MSKHTPRHRKVVLYIAGPMTGIKDKNIHSFDAAENLLTTIGYATINPARHEAPGKTWKDYMALGIKDLLDADHVALLPGWQNSKGALLEVSIAEALEKQTEPVDYWIGHK